MRFYVDHARKVAFGWTPKAGCRHVKMLLAYLTSVYRAERAAEWLREFERDVLAYMRSLTELRERAVPKGYTVFMFVRNPFKRIVSAYLRAIRPGSAFAKRLRLPVRGYTLMHLLTDVEQRKRARDADFVAHFHPQTAEDFATGALGCDVVVWDIAAIDYERLERVYGKPIPLDIRYWRAEYTEIPMHLEPRWHTAQLESAHLDTIRRIYRVDFEFLEAHGVDCAPPPRRYHGGMRFLVDRDRKVAFGWSAKAGCRHVHLVFAYLTGQLVPRRGVNDPTWLPRLLFADRSVTDLASDREVPQGYTVYAVTRSPSERLRSGFIRTLRDHPNATTIDKLLEDMADADSWVYRDEHVAHHLCPQTNGGYCTLNDSHTVHVWDIASIDYAALEERYGVMIPMNVRECRTDIPDPPMAVEPLAGPRSRINDSADVFLRLFHRDLELRRQLVQ